MDTNFFNDQNMVGSQEMTKMRQEMKNLREA